MTPEILPEQIARERLEAKQEALDDVEMLLNKFQAAPVGPEGWTESELHVARSCIEACRVIVLSVRRELPRRPKKP